MVQQNPDSDVVIMQDPDRWIQWPFLPVKQADRNSNHDIGFLFETSLSGEAKPTVYEGNVFGIKGIDISTLPQKVYNSFQELYDAGWRVD